MPKPYPQEFRDDVVRVARDRGDGVSIEQVAKDFGSHGPLKHSAGPCLGGPSAAGPGDQVAMGLPRASPHRLGGRRDLGPLVGVDVGGMTVTESSSSDDGAICLASHPGRTLHHLAS